MANYSETTGSGSAWKRARQVLIKNDLLKEQKPIIFFEEDAVVLGDKTITADSRVFETIYDPNAVINLRDPATGELTGNVVTQGLVYQALYSMYLDLAVRRDSAVNENPENIFQASPENFN